MSRRGFLEVESLNLSKFPKPVFDALHSHTINRSKSNFLALLLQGKGDVKIFRALEDMLFSLPQDFDLEEGRSLVDALLLSELSKEQKIALLQKVPSEVLGKIVQHDLENPQGSSLLEKVPSQEKEIASLLLEAVAIPQGKNRDELMQALSKSLDGKINGLSDAAQQRVNSDLVNEVSAKAVNAFLEKLFALSNDEPAANLDKAKKEKLAEIFIEKGNPDFFLKPIVGKALIEESERVRLTAALKVGAIENPKAFAKAVASGDSLQVEDALDSGFQKLWDDPKNAALREAAKDTVKLMRRARGESRFLTWVSSEGKMEIAKAEYDMFVRLAKDHISKGTVPSRQERVQIAEEFKNEFSPTSNTGFFASLLKPISYNKTPKFNEESNADKTVRLQKEDEVNIANNLKDGAQKAVAAERLNMRQDAVGNKALKENNEKFSMVADAVVRAAIREKGGLFEKDQIGLVDEAMQTEAAAKASYIVMTRLLENFGADPEKLTNSFPGFDFNNPTPEGIASGLSARVETRNLAQLFEENLEFNADKKLTGIDAKKLFAVDADQIRGKFVEASEAVKLAQGKAKANPQAEEGEEPDAYRKVAQAIVKAAIRQTHAEKIGNSENLENAYQAVMAKLYEEYPDVADLKKDFTHPDQKHLSKEECIEASARQVSENLGMSFNVVKGTFSDSVIVAGVNPDLASIRIKPIDINLAVARVAEIPAHIPEPVSPLLPQNETVEVAAPQPQQRIIPAAPQVIPIANPVPPKAYTPAPVSAAYSARSEEVVDPKKSGQFKDDKERQAVYAEVSRSLVKAIVRKGFGKDVEVEKPLQKWMSDSVNEILQRTYHNNFDELKKDFPALNKGALPNSFNLPSTGAKVEEVAEVMASRFNFTQKEVPGLFGRKTIEFGVLPLEQDGQRHFENLKTDFRAVRSLGVQENEPVKALDKVKALASRFTSAADIAQPEPKLPPQQSVSQVIAPESSLPAAVQEAIVDAVKPLLPKKPAPRVPVEAASPVVEVAPTPPLPPRLHRKQDVEVINPALAAAQPSPPASIEQVQSEIARALAESVARYVLSEGTNKAEFVGAKLPQEQLKQIEKDILPVVSEKYKTMSDVRSDFPLFNEKENSLRSESPRVRSMGIGISPCFKFDLGENNQVNVTPRSPSVHNELIKSFFKIELDATKNIEPKPSSVFNVRESRPSQLIAASREIGGITQ